jgi:hypothetical protein
VSNKMMAVLIKDAENIDVIIVFSYSDIVS